MLRNVKELSGARMRYLQATNNKPETLWLLKLHAGKNMPVVFCCSVPHLQGFCFVGCAALFVRTAQEPDSPAAATLSGFRLFVCGCEGHSAYGLVCSIAGDHMGSTKQRMFV